MHEILANLHAAFAGLPPGVTSIPGPTAEDDVLSDAAGMVEHAFKHAARPVRCAAKHPVKVIGDCEMEMDGTLVTVDLPRLRVTVPFSMNADQVLRWAIEDAYFHACALESETR